MSETETEPEAVETTAPVERDGFQNPVLQSLRDLAAELPGVKEGTSCVKRAFKAGNKGFLYLGENDSGRVDIMVKLDESSEEAAKLAHDDPEHYAFGDTHWMTAKFPSGDTVPEGLFENWVYESFRLQAPVELREQLNAEDDVETDD